MSIVKSQNLQISCDKQCTPKASSGQDLLASSTPRSPSPALAFRTKGVDYRADREARYVWIGATRADRRSAWSWTDCSDWTLSRWGRSDGDDPALTSGPCGTLFFSGRWRDDVNCTDAKYK